jgi:hypothetical protein
MENKELLELTLKYCKAQREVFVIDGDGNVVTSYSVDTDKGLKQETLTYTEAVKKEERIFNSTMMSKQETLEDAMNRDGYHESDYDTIWREGVQFGLKWQQEQDKNKYSEQDMQEYATFCIRCHEQGLPCIIAQDWFKLYKNK